MAGAVYSTDQGGEDYAGGEVGGKDVALTKAR
jgi:hypothetical protein